VPGWGRPGLATGKRWREALGGSPFSIVDADLSEGPTVGGFGGGPDSPGSIGLRFRVGRLRRFVEVETNARGGILLAELSHGPNLLSSARQRRMRYPLVIERTQLKVRVGGRSRVFKGLAIRDIAAVTALVDGVVVSVRCPEGVPSEGLSLARLDDREFDQLIRSEGERWVAMRRNLKPPSQAARR
jgi:hypothetical protein